MTGDDASEELKEELLHQHLSPKESSKPSQSKSSSRKTPISFTPEQWDAFLAKETQQLAELSLDPILPKGLEETEGGLWTLRDYSSFFNIVFDTKMFALCVYWHTPNSKQSVENLVFLEQQLANFPLLRILVVDLTVFPQLLCQLDASPLTLQCFLFGKPIDSNSDDFQTTFFSFARSLDSHFPDFLLHLRPHNAVDPSEFRRRAVQNESFGIYPLMNEMANTLNTLLQNLHTECADTEKERKALEVGSQHTRSKRSFYLEFFRIFSIIQIIQNSIDFEEVPKNYETN